MMGKKYELPVIEVRIDSMFYSKEDNTNIDLYKLHIYMRDSTVHVFALCMSYNMFLINIHSISNLIMAQCVIF